MYYFRKGVLLDMISRGHEVHIVSPVDFKTQDLIDLGCIHHAVNFSTKSVNPFADLVLFLKFIKTYRRIKPDFIFHYTIKPNIYGSIAASLLYIKSIAIVTGLGYAFINNNWINWLVKRMYQFALGFPYQVWFLNEADIHYFIDKKLVSKSSAFHLPGEGVNTSEFAFKPMPQHNNFTFLLIARMLKDKGVYEFVEAAHQIKSKYPNCKFQLLGPADSDNPSAISLAQIKNWDQSGVIEYIGTANDVRPYIEQAHCIVLPSYREGISKVLMEAASMGRPLLASNVPGCIELIEEGKNGLLVNVRSAKSLEEGMLQMMQLTQTELASMGANSRAKMLKEFDEEIIVDFYRKILVQDAPEKNVIAFVVNTDWFFISHRLPLALEAQKRGYSPIVISTDTGKADEIRKYGITFVDLNLTRSGINPITEFKVVWKLLKIYMKYKPVIVHHVTIKPVLYGSLAARFSLFNTQVVNAISGLGYAFINTYKTLSFWVIRILMRFALQSNRVNFIFQNPDDLTFYQHQGYLNAKNHRLIRGAGIDVKLWKYSAPDVHPKLRVMFSGRMLHDKGIIEFIEAAKLLQEKWMDKVEFLMVGDVDLGNPKSLSKSEIEQYLIPDYLIWAGHQEDMPKQCMLSDIVCLPSYREGLPKSLLEAMSVGRPIVTTDVPGCRECVDDGVNGFLVPAKEYTQLASRIDELLTNESMRFNMGLASRIKAENEFSLEIVIEQTFDFYQKILRRDGINKAKLPKISIITAVYNNKLFIRDAIESVLNQTYENVEYIVIDGGSTDGSKEIINNYANRIHLIVSEPDKGLYDALNKGIAMATGEVIGIMHSDDFYSHRNVLSKVATKFNTNTDAVFGDLDYVSNHDSQKIIRRWRTKNYARSKFKSGWMPPHPTVFIRKRVFEQYGAYNTALRSSADYELLLRLFYLKNINVTFLKDVLVKMRIGGQSNRTLGNRIKAHIEDYKAWKTAGLKPAVYTMWFKLLRKLPQYRFW
jgi:glycosyltransferase involved in cell wall biosynthesis